MQVFERRDFKGIVAGLLVPLLSAGRSYILSGIAGFNRELTFCTTPRRALILKMPSMRDQTSLDEGNSYGLSIGSRRTPHTPRQHRRD